MKLILSKKKQKIFLKLFGAKLVLIEKNSFK